LFVAAMVPLKLALLSGLATSASFTHHEIKKLLAHVFTHMKQAGIKQDKQGKDGSQINIEVITQLALGYYTRGFLFGGILTILSLPSIIDIAF
jgi:hypothetical protein